MAVGKGGLCWRGSLEGGFPKLRTFVTALIEMAWLGNADPRLQVGTFENTLRIVMGGGRNNDANANGTHPNVKFSVQSRRRFPSRFRSSPPSAQTHIEKSLGSYTNSQPASARYPDVHYHWPGHMGDWPLAPRTPFPETGLSGWSRPRG